MHLSVNKRSLPFSDEIWGILKCWMSERLAAYLAKRGGTNPQTLYACQGETMRCMNKINQELSYSVLIVPLTRECDGQDQHRLTCWT